MRIMGSWIIDEKPQPEGKKGTRNPNFSPNNREQRDKVRSTPKKGARLELEESSQ